MDIINYEQKLADLASREATINLRADTLASEKREFNAKLDNLFEAVKALFGEDVILVKKSVLDSIESRLEDSRSAAEEAKDTLSNLSYEVSNAESSADSAFEEADSALDELRDLLSSI